MIIYLITNTINNKVYVGLTTRTLGYRKNIHKQDWKLGRKSKYKLYQAFTKYTFDAFSWSVLDTASSLEELKEKEKQWILYYNSYNKGYNMTTGGDYNPNIGKFGAKHHNSKTYIITDPLGNTFTITGLRKFARENNLDHTALSAVANGKVKQHLGYVCKHLEPSTTS